MDLFNEAGNSSKQSLSVTELVRISHDHMRQLWREKVWISGELSNVKQYPSRHVYLTLKDQGAEVSCIMYARQAEQLARLPQDGDEVIVHALPTFYQSKGRFQLVIHTLQAQGQGKLYEDFIQLKNKLREQGWFEPEHKRAFSAYPACVGVVVSEQGAAWRDVKKTLALRYPQAQVLVFPAPAQGDGAAGKLAAAIAAASSSDCDVVLICRGGGSFEDLAAYNTLEVATAIYECQVPVISGVGHETDETIADYVADLRAATPTAAAVAAVPDQLELQSWLDEQQRRLNQAVIQATDNSYQRFDEASGRLRQAIAELVSRTSQWIKFTHQALERSCNLCLNTKQHDLAMLESRLQQRVAVLANSSSHLDSLQARLHSVLHNLLARHHQRLNNQIASLQALNPQRTLARGFALVTTADGEVLVSAAQLRHGEQATLVLQDGARHTKLGEPAARPDFLTLIHD